MKDGIAWVPRPVRARRCFISVSYFTTSVGWPRIKRLRWPGGGGQPGPATPRQKRSLPSCGCPFIRQPAPASVETPWPHGSGADLTRSLRFHKLMGRKFVGLSSVGRARGCGPRGRGFESRSPTWDGGGGRVGDRLQGTGDGIVLS